MTQAGSWIIETDEGGAEARSLLQIMNGDYRQGVMIIECETSMSPNLERAIEQLITSNIILQRLDILKVFPTTRTTMILCDEWLPEYKKPIMTFKIGAHTEPMISSQFHLERDCWLQSERGLRALSELNWLQKRLQRESKSRQFATQNQATPWLFRFLSLGRRRLRRQATPHPLDIFRSRL